MTRPTLDTTAPAPARKRRGPVYWIGMAISGVLLIGVLVIAALVVAVPALTRSTPYTILTGSMDPVYPPGTLVIVKPIDPQQIKLGDVVTYQLKSGEGSVVTHRVVEIQAPSVATKNELRFITKGDANDVQDELPVRPVQIRGTVWYAVPYIGWVNNVVNGDMRPVIIPIVAGGLFLYAGWMMVSGLVDRRRRTGAAAVIAAGVPLPDLREDPADEPQTVETVDPAFVRTPEPVDAAALAGAADEPEPVLEAAGPRRSRFEPPVR